MSESLVLSALFIGIVVLIAFAGTSFGLARGFLATAAIFIGFEVALWWGNDLGRRLTSAGGMSEATGRFLSGLILLLVVVLLLGIAGSALLRWGTPTRWGALLGGLLGAANGALLIAMVLRLYYIAYDGTLGSMALDKAIVSRVLWRNFDWFILGFALIAIVLLLYTRLARIETTIPDPVARVTFARPVPPPVSRQQLESIRVRSAKDAMPPNGLSDPPGDHRPIDNTVYAPPHATVANNPAGRNDGPGVVAVQEAQQQPRSTRTQVRYCPNCGMTLEDTDHFCPDCGFTL